MRDRLGRRDGGARDPGRRSGADRRGPAARRQGYRPPFHAARRLGGRVRRPARRARGRPDARGRRRWRGAGPRPARAACRRSSMPRPRWSPTHPLARVDLAERGRPHRRRSDAQTHAGVGGAATSRSTPRTFRRTSPAATATATATSAARSPAAVVREGRFASQWIHQGYLEPQTCTAWLDERRHAGLETSTQSLFGARNEVAKALGWPQRRVRAVGDAARRRRSAGSGRCSTRSSPPRPRGKLRRPVRLVADAIGGLRRDEPGPAVRDDAPDRRGRRRQLHRPRGARRRRRRRIRGGQRRVARRRARRRPVRLAGVRHQGLRRANQPVRRRGLSRAQRAGDGLRASRRWSTSSRSSSSSIRSSSGGATSRPRARRWSTARTVAGPRRGGGPRRARGERRRGGDAARTRGDGRGRRAGARLLAGRDEPGRGGLPDVARRAASRS